MAISIRRLRTHATIALANAIALFVTIYAGWSLTEASLAYLGEMLILALVVCARVIAAKRLAAGASRGSWWQLAGAKTIAIGITLPVYATMIAFILLLLFGNTVPRGEEVFTNIRLSDSTWRGLALCWFGFLVPHVIGFVENARLGAYDALISDSRLMSPMWRYPPLMLAGIAIAGETQGAPIVPWFFVGTLALMAIVDTATYIYEMDAAKAAVRRARTAGSTA